MKQGHRDSLSKMKQAMSARDFDAAAQIGRKLIRKYPERTDFQLMTSVSELQGSYLSQGGLRLIRLLKAVERNDRHIGMIFQNLMAFARATSDYSSVIDAAEHKHRAHSSEPLYAEFLARLIVEDHARHAVGRCHSDRILQAIKLLEGIPGSFERFADVRMLLASLYVDCEMTEQAFALLDDMVLSDPHNSELREFQISVWAIFGKVDQAVSASLDLIARQANVSARPYLTIAFLRPFAMPDGAETRLKDIFASQEISARDRYNAGFTLARIYESRHQMAEAFEWYRSTHDANRQEMPFDISAEQAEINKIAVLSVQQNDVLVDMRKEHSGPKPIFVLGMPRSGTTLAERILGAHSAVYAAGEIGDFAFIIASVVGPGSISEQMARLDNKAILDIRKQYLAAMGAYAPDARYVTNKTPANFLRLGLIRRVFPDSPIIHCERHPLATCLSIYTTPFGRPMRFSDDLQDMADYYRGYQNLMSVFEETDSNHQIFNLNYEDLVASPDHVARAFLMHCGLSWEPQCLEFYRDSRASQTASLMQVRRPINSESVDKWQRFEPFIGPLATLSERIEKKTKATFAA
ncbi:MAG: sulfotransferase [Pseudomonadota bacterium]